MRPKTAKSVRSRSGLAYPADLVPGLGRAGHHQRQAGGQPGPGGGQEPQLPAVVVVPRAQHRSGDMPGHHRQRHQVDVTEQCQAGRVGRPARRRRPVQGAQEQQRSQRRDQHREGVEPDLLGEPRHAGHQGEHQPGGQAGPGSGQPPAHQRHAGRRGRHGEHGQRAHRVGGVPERRDPPVQQQVVGQLGGAGVTGARDQARDRAAGERPAGQLVPPQLGAAHLVQAEDQGQQRRPAPGQPRELVGQALEAGPAGRDAGPALAGPRDGQVLPRISGNGHRAVPRRLLSSRPRISAAPAVGIGRAARHPGAAGHRMVLTLLPRQRVPPWDGSVAYVRGAAHVRAPGPGQAPGGIRTGFG